MNNKNEVHRPWSDNFFATPVGIVDYRVEALVSPLPEDDLQRMSAKVKNKL